MQNDIVKSNINRELMPYIYLLIGILLMIFSNGRWVMPIFSWFCFIFIIRFLSMKKPLKGSIICIISFIIANSIMWRDVILTTGFGWLYYTSVGIMMSIPFLISTCPTTRRNFWTDSTIFATTSPA